MNTLLNLEGTVYRKLDFMLEQFCDKTWNNRTTANLILIVVSIMVAEGFDSVRSLYTHFLAQASTKSLNAYYYAIGSNAAVDYHYFLGAIAAATLSLIVNDLATAPVLIVIDDSTIAKFGTHFDAVGKLFDHSSHQKDKYVNGHCFVGMCLKVPIHSATGWVFLSIPLGYRMWDKDKGISKLQLAGTMVDEVMKKVGTKRRAIILCDAWYGKKYIFSLADKYPNLDVIANVRIDTAMYNLPVLDPHKRGRKPKKGSKITRDDFVLGKYKVGEFFVDTKEVITNLTSQKAWALLSGLNPEKGGTKRLFISTIAPTELASLMQGYGKFPKGVKGKKWEPISPLVLYFERWSIETSFFEQKAFWSLKKYMVRSGKGIQMVLNLICLAYSFVKLLPYMSEDYAQYKGESPQTLRLVLSNQLKEEAVYASLLQRLAAGDSMEKFTVAEKAVIEACQRYQAVA